jgi:signal recognition particle 43 kDa protein
LRAFAGGGADVGHRERASGGLTPLHITVRYGRAAAVRALLELGSDPDAPDGRGRISLELFQVVLLNNSVQFLPCNRNQRIKHKHLL